jgi:predicted NBD/HSP70 family sugar kinase
LGRLELLVYSPYGEKGQVQPLQVVKSHPELSTKIGLPLTLENDNSAAAWGEFRFGAGGEVDHLVFVGLGTGIGGGVISHGVLLRGTQGAGGELGHVTIHATGPRCACGNHGCLEALASGTAIARRARELAVARPRRDKGGHFGSAVRGARCRSPRPGSLLRGVRVAQVRFA